MTEELVIRFLSDNIEEGKVRQFLLDYYNSFNMADNKVLVISDTHLGRIYGDYNLLALVYNFALKKNIKYIIHAGDIIEGCVNLTLVNSSEEVQLEELLKKNILEFPRLKHFIYLVIMIIQHLVK